MGFRLFEKTNFVGEEIYFFPSYVMGIMVTGAKDV